MLMVPNEVAAVMRERESCARPGSFERLRVGVVGVGRISQLAHLPWLARESTRFDLAGIADVSPLLSATIGKQYGVEALPSVEDLLELDLDAIICATPISLHSDIVIKALGAGVHVLCEKPIALTLRECNEMIRARDAADCVVQVGYMKRLDPGTKALLAELPASSEDVRYISVEVIDPYYGPFTVDQGLIEPDLPPDHQSRIRALEADQVREATGQHLSPAAYCAYRHGYVGSLIHDVNLLHGIVDILQATVPVRVQGGHFWAGGRAVDAIVELDGGGSAHLAHVALSGVPHYQERVTVFCTDRILELTFASPYLARRTARLVARRSVGSMQLETTELHHGYDDPFRLQLCSFHAAVTGIGPTMNTLEEAKRDLDLLIRVHRMAMGFSPLVTGNQTAL